MDTNQNNVVDDNEFRSLVAILKGGKVPVRESDITYYKTNCSLYMNANSGSGSGSSSGSESGSSGSKGFDGEDGEEDEVESIIKDEYGVLRVGSISRTLYPTVAQLSQCPVVIRGIKEYASWYTPNPTYILGSEKDVAFEMIGDNATDTLSQLDSVRARQSKFICINDNIHNLSDELAVIVMEFFEAMFPISSQFELLHGQRNPTLYTDEYRTLRDEHVLGLNLMDIRSFIQQLSRWGRGLRHQWIRYVQSMALKILSFTYSSDLNDDTGVGSSSGSGAGSGAGTRSVYVHYDDRSRGNANSNSNANRVNRGHGSHGTRRRLFEMSRSTSSSSSTSSSGGGGANINNDSEEEMEIEIVFTGEFTYALITTVILIIIALALTCGCRIHLTKQKVKKLEKLHSDEGSTFKVMKSKKAEDEQDDGAEGTNSTSNSTATGGGSSSSNSSGGTTGEVEGRSRRGSFYDDKMTASLSDFNKASTVCPPTHGDPLNDLWRTSTKNPDISSDTGTGDPLNDIWAKAGYGTVATPDTNVIYESMESRGSYVNTNTNKSILISRPNSSYSGNKNLDLYANTVDGEPVKRGLFAFAVS